MPNYNVTNNIDTLLRSTSNAAARTSLELGDAATKNTGTTAGTVAAGDDSRITGALQTSGGTMTGKLTAAASDTEAKLNVGSRLTTGAPSTIAAGDIWISNQGSLSYRDSTGPTSRAVAATSLSNTFNQPQTIGSTANAGAVLSVSNSGTREVVTISNTATATSDAVVITNLGSGNSLVVNDETTPDSTRFAVANNGRVGIGVAPDAVVALAVDSTGIKFSDGTTQTTAASGGSGTVTSITAGTGLTGGTITTSGTVAADFGTTTGKVTEGGTTVLKTGDTMSGKLNLGNVASTAPVNLGANVSPTPLVNGDVWLNTSNQLTWRGNNGATYPAASTSAINSFVAAQGISASTAGAVLGVTQTTGAGTALVITQNATGTGSGITVDLNNTASTATAVRITNQGTGASLVVEDQSSVDPTPFTISNGGRVGVGVAPDAAVALSVDSTGIKFSDGTIQTTASGGGVAGVSSFSAGTTGLTPATGTTGAVTLAGTLGVANGGTGQTTANAALNALLPSQASNSGKVLSTDGTNTSWITAGGGGGLTTQVDRYLTTQNVTVPAGAKKLDVFCVGAGGSGGGGSGGNGTLANRGGGGGGGGGGFSTASFNATNLPASIQVVVGAAGAAGNGGVGLNDGTSAGASGRSGITTIGSDIATFPSLIVAFSGNAGSGGSTTGTSGAAASGATSALFAGTNGGTGGSSGGAGSAGSAQNASAGARAATGGGGGGAISTSTFANGGAGGNLVLQSFGGGGAAGTTNGANGGNGWTALYDGQVASGGGGAAGSSTNTGGTGGAGGFPGGGGGGGGAGLNDGGSGGVGGAGIVVLTWYF